MSSIDECLHIAAIPQACRNLNSSRKVLSKIFINDANGVVCITNICIKQKSIKSTMRKSIKPDCIYTVSQKRDLYTFAHNFGTCWRIFKIFSLLNSSRNLQQTGCHISHRTINVLLHYLVKWQLSQTVYCRFITYVTYCESKPIFQSGLFTVYTPTIAGT